ncbi:MAG TPA: proton-conducting transporter membrane subunit [Pirellulaceae bacterium]|nr:proton-conducting transporter membrane subunit [Pirellulaceae bacterium]
MDSITVIQVLASLVLLSPLMLVVYCGVQSIFGFVGSERATSGWTTACIVFGLLATAGTAVVLVATGGQEWTLELGSWVALPNHSFEFHLKFIFDWLSLPFVLVTYILAGVVAAFASRYLHKEAGFQRFFLLYALFVTGLVVSALAGTIEVLFFGWELVGLASALLVGFFHERIGPVSNGLRVWSVYRLADAAFLTAALALHHMSGSGDFDQMTGSGAWPHAVTILNSHQAFGVGLLLLIAAAGKSALIPFSGWLPRAMEGPTPSSAIFYGALSVHLGAYLLLRISPLIAASPGLGMGVVSLGLATALYANIVARVQADIKSALAFASLTQVGLIVAEIGMGWWYLALVHMIGHAMMRTLQLLRAPNLLHDYFKLETALGQRIVRRDIAPWLSRFPTIRNRLYRFALERGHFDSLLNDYLVEPVLALFRWCALWESRWIAMGERARPKSGQPGNEPHHFSNAMNNTRLDPDADSVKSDSQERIWHDS